MINKTDILKLVHGLAGSRPVVKREFIAPSRDWWIMLMVFATIVIFGSAWFTLRYLAYQTVDEAVGTEATQVPRYRESQVLDVLDMYRSRNVKYISLVNDKPYIESVDDSLSSTTDTAAASSTEVQFELE